MKSDYLYSLNNIKGTLKLYHVSNDGTTAEQETNPNFDLVFDGTDKWCYFDITHNSKFVIASGSIKIKTREFKSSGSTYSVLSNGKTVALSKAKNKKSVNVPSVIKVKGKKYKVTQINEKAFTGSKIRIVTLGKNVKVIKKKAFAKSKVNKLVIKTKLLKKSKVKGSLMSSKVATIQVKVGGKSANKKYAKMYKKIFAKKNSGRKVIIK